MRGLVARGLRVSGSIKVKQIIIRYQGCSVLGLRTDLLRFSRFEDISSVWSQSRWRTFFYWFLLIFFLAVGACLRLSNFNPDRAIVEGDEYTYSNAANSLLEYGYMVRNPYVEKQEAVLFSLPTAALSPGYPVFVAMVYAITDKSLSAIFYIQFMLSMVTMLLIFVALKLLEVRRYLLLVGVLVSACYPGFIYNNDRMLTEHLFTFLLLGFAVAFVKFLRSGSIGCLLLASILVACAIHVRAQAIPFCLLAFVFTLIYGNGSLRQRLRQVLMFSVCVIAAMLPYWIYNYEVLGRVLILPETGEGPMIWGAVPYFLDMPATTNIPLADTIAANSTPAPAIYWKWRVFGFINQMWGDVWDENLVHAQPLLRPWLLLQHFVIVPTVIALPLLARRFCPPVIFFAAIPLAMTYMTMPFHGLSRYAFPAIPYVLILFVVLIDMGLDSIKFGSGIRANPLVERWRLWGDYTVRCGFFVAALALSVATAFSVYFFAWNIHKEMSAYRLARYLDTTPEGLERNKPVMSKLFEASELPVGNATKLAEGLYKKNLEATALIGVVVPGVSKGDGKAVATKLELNISGGFLYDFMTVYWKSQKVTDFSESHVYPRFPINAFERRQVVYIDDDVTELLIVPSGFRGGEVKVQSIEVKKFEVEK